MNCQATLAREYAQLRLQRVQARLRQVRRQLRELGYAEGEMPALARPAKPGPEELARANSYLSRLGVPAEVLEVRS